MTDDKLLAQFEATTLPGECFHHREHVRVGFLYLQRFPVLEALTKFSCGLKALATALGKPQRYHETITIAYILLIRDRMCGGAETWEQFAQANPDLLIWKGGILEQYYDPETLASDAARAGFIFPDRVLAIA